MRRNLLWLLSVLVCGTLLLSCNAKPKNSTFHTGEWVQAGDYDVFVHNVVQDPQGTGGKRLVFIEVEYANHRSTEALSCRRNQWYLYDNQGYSYEAESNNSLYESKNLQYLGGDHSLNRDMQLRGWLAFSVPQTATITRIQFMTAFLDTQTADILLEGTE